MNDWTIADGIERTERILGQKANEYVRNNDRLYNFRRIQQLLKAEYQVTVSLSFIVQILQYKHRISVLDMNRDIQLGKTYTQEMIDEKQGDYTNYCYLYELALREENEAARNKHNARTTESE